MENISKSRQSGIELLKIVAIILICISHAAQTLNKGFIPLESQLNITTFITAFCRNFGSIGNCVFIACSAYFLIDSKKVKAEKIFRILIDSVLISVIFLLFFITVGNQNFTSQEIVELVLPDFFSKNWFIPCYLLMYAVFPLLNGALEKMNKATNLLVVIIFTVLWGLVDSFSAHFFCNDLLTFFVLYFAVGYSKKFMSKLNDGKFAFKTFLILLSIFIVAFLGLYFAGLKVEFFSSHLLFFCKILNPFIFPMCIALIYVFKNFKFESKVINYISSLSLFVYLIHENFLFRTITRKEIYTSLFNINGSWGLLWLLVMSLIHIVGGIILAIIYKESLGRLAKIVANWITKICKKVYLKFVALFSKVFD